MTLKGRALLLVSVLLLAGCGVSGEGGNYSNGGDYEPPAQSIENADAKTPERAERPNVTTTTVPDDDEVKVTPFEENQIVLTAQSLLGIEFTDGGSSPDEGFDNSGFIHYVLKQSGYTNSPRGLREQAVMGNEIGSISELISGDLVFFSDNGERATFGGIYIGDGIMISCRMPGETVMEFNITIKYYLDSFFTGIRVL
jgi:cell wall-associated NlpC family hydrolase